MTRSIQPGSHSLELKFVNVQHIGEFTHNILEPLLECGFAHNFFASFNGRWLALDVRQDSGDLRNLASHFRFQPCDFIMRLLHAETFVQLQMLFDVQLSIEVLDADVVNVKVVARGYSADTIKDIFRASGPWN